MNAPKFISTIQTINANRTKYGFPPIEDEREIQEEVACDQIAEDWVRLHGGIELFREKYDEIVSLFDCEISHREGRIELCGIVDQWEETHGLSGDDFQRLRKEIEGWIVSHSACRGRKH